MEKRRSRRRVGYADVMATLAVFIALGGGAWAVGVGRDDISAREIAKNAVRSSELKNGQVKGRDVDEDSLGDVPSALTADSADTASSASTADNATNAQNAVNAQTADTASTAGSASQVNGLSIVRINSRQPASTPAQTILSLAGLQLKMTCEASNLQVSAETTKANSSIYLHGVLTDTNAPADDFAFDREGGAFSPATPVDVDLQLGGGGSFPILVNIVYESSDSSVVTVDVAIDINGTSKCVATGTAIGG